MTKEQEALKLALETLEELLPIKFSTVDKRCKAITAIREALAQPEEKVDWEKLYRLEVKKKDALAAKYERDIKPLTKIVPMAQPGQEPCHKRRNEFCNCQKKAMLCDGFGEPKQEPVAIKHMAEWVEYLKRQSDHGQHLRIPSGMSAGTCLDLARELEQFINTTQPQRTWQGLTDEDFLEACQLAENGNYLVAFQRIQAKLKQKNGYAEEKNT